MSNVKAGAILAFAAILVAVIIIVSSFVMRLAFAEGEAVVADAPIVGHGFSTIVDGRISILENDPLCRYIFSAPRARWPELIREAGIECPLRPDTCPVRDDYGDCGSGGQILIVNEDGFQQWTTTE